MSTRQNNNKENKKRFKTFEDLERYKKAREFRKKIYELIRKLPLEEKYNLKYWNLKNSNTNSKSEILNSKQYLITKIQISKPICLEIKKLGFVICSGFRYWKLGFNRA